MIGSLGCDPTQPAFTEGASNLVGSITHDQSIDGRLKLTEIPLFDQGGGETVNNTYLGAQRAFFWEMVRAPVYAFVNLPRSMACRGKQKQPGSQHSQCWFSQH